MAKLRNTIIKLCSFVFAVCAAFAIATIPQAKTVDAQEDASFKVNGASVYKYDGADEGKIGLRFEAEFNTAWLDAHSAEKKYTFGIIIAPTANFEAAEAVGAEKPWSDNNNPTQNMEAVDGINFIRIQNTAVPNGDKIYASIRFDDDSLKAAIAEYRDVEDVNEIEQSDVDDLRANFYKQSYTAVAYASYGSEVVYLPRYTTTMRETAAKTYALGVDKGNANDKALALPYLGLTNDDVYSQTAYVLQSDKKVVVDSAENYEATESTMIVADGKVLKLGTDYTIENGDIVLTETKASNTVETVIVIDDTMLNVVEVAYVDVALSTAQEVADYFALDEEADSALDQETKSNDLSAVLTQDIDMAGITLSNYVSFDYTGSFDGRGHVLSNVTVQTINPDAEKPNTTTYSLFGNVKSSAVIKNVAFSDIKSVDHQLNAAVLGYSFAGLLENVYVSYSVDNKSTTGLFVTANSGTMENVVIVDNYDISDFNKNAYIDTYVSAWGISPISRRLGSSSATFKNVQVISRRPINYYSEDSKSFDVTYTTDEGSAATVDKWGAYCVYAENETELFVEFEYFYRSTTDKTGPGLGLNRDTATVQDTVGCGKTIVKGGIRRYDDMEAFIADGANAENRAKLIATGFWKEDDKGSIVWANSANISEQGEYVGEVDYDASTGILYSTAWNGGKISYVILDGAVLTKENGGLVLDGENNIVGIHAKANADDEDPGIAYRTNGDSSNVINYEGKLSICVDNKVYNIRKVNYYTKLIFNANDLREAVGCNVKYEVRTYTADEATDRETELNGKGYFVATTKSGSNYYEGVYNAGIYKMMADVNMYHEDKNNPENSGPKGIGYTDNPLDSNSEIGGFVGYFDGNGYTIVNFKPDAQGLFGRVSTYVAGNVVAGTNVTAGRRYVDCEPVIKNLALTDVITTYYDETNFYATPILANLLGTNMGYAPPHTTTVENIYVTVSSESTALGNFITQIGGAVKINNLYLVNTNEFGMEKQDNNKFRLTDDPSRANVTIDSDTKIYNLFTNYGKANNYEGVLFGHAYTDVSKAPDQSGDAIKKSVDSITSTYVVTTMPISYYTYGTPFKYTYSDSYLCVKTDAEKGVVLPKENLYKLGQVSVTENKACMAIAYAANEEVGNIPVMYGIKKSVIDDVKAAYNTTQTLPANNSNTAFMCDSCGEIAFNHADYRTVKAGTACCYTYNDVACNGKFEAASKYKVPGSTGQFNTPVLYTFTYHTAADMGEYYSNNNGAWKLKFVMKYADVEAMKKANNDYSSFTGEAGNGLWNVVEGELKWVGRVA